MVGSAAQRFVAPVAKLLAPWLLIQPERALESILYAATAPADQVISCHQVDIIKIHCLPHQQEE